MIKDKQSTFDPVQLQVIMPSGRILGDNFKIS